MILATFKSTNNLLLIINLFRPNKELPEDQPQHGTTKYKGKLSDSMKFCNEVLRDMFHKKHQAYAWPFYKPVDAVALGQYLRYFLKISSLGVRLYMSIPEIKFVLQYLLITGLHDYHKVITHPMDLGTVKSKMDRRK